MSDIVRIDAYFVDTLGTERWLHYFEDNDNFNVLTGQVSFESTILDYFDGVISDAKQEHSQVDDYDAYIVLDFNIEKYRDITIERDDITSEEAHRIATMQSAHQSILEYTYQFTIAESTQDRLNEICYTAFITITSTIIVMGATWGLNKAFNKYGSQHLLNKADDIYAQGELTASMQKSINSLTTSAASMMSKAGRSASMNAYIVVKSVIEETLEELYVDPMIEAYVTNKVKDLGYDQTAQILWSGLAESGREQFLSSVTAFARAGASIKTQTDVQLSLDLQSQSLNVEQRLQLIQEQIQARQDTQTNWKKAMKFIGEGISALLLSAGAISGGIGGSLGVSFGNMLTVGAVSTEGIKFIKDMGDIILKKEPSMAQNNYLSDKITDSLQALVNIEKINQKVLGEAIKWAQLDQPQKQKQANYKYIASNFDVWSDMVRLQGGILGIRPVGIYLDPNDPNNFIGQRIESFRSQIIEGTGLSRQEISDFVNELKDEEMKRSSTALTTKNALEILMKNWGVLIPRFYKDGTIISFNDDRDPIISRRVKLQLELMLEAKRNGLLGNKRFYVIYGLVQKKSLFTGVDLPRPIFEVGYQSSPSEMKVRLKTIFKSMFGTSSPSEIYIQLNAGTL